MKTIKTAEDLHGHLGPFLVMGVRMGLLGLKKLKTKKGDEKLSVTVSLKYSTPISCVLDGIQTSTKCTFGNKKLKLKKLNNPSKISAKFSLNNKKWVEISINPSFLKRLKEKLFGEKFSKDMRKLAYLVASIPEKEIFIVKQNVPNL